MTKTNVRGGQIADGSNGVDLQVDVTNTLLVPNGGTGKTSAGSNNLLTGNGTAAFGEIAPGSNGDVLQVSDGAWTSQAANTGTQRTFAYFAG